MKIFLVNSSKFLQQIKTTMDQITQQIEPLKQFGKDSIRLVKRCTKPDRWGIISISQNSEH